MHIHTYIYGEKQRKFSIWENAKRPANPVSFSGERESKKRANKSNGREGNKQNGSTSVNKQLFRWYEWICLLFQLLLRRADALTSRYVISWPLLPTFCLALWPEYFPVSTLDQHTYIHIYLQMYVHNIVNLCLVFACLYVHMYVYSYMVVIRHANVHLCMYGISL